MEMPAGVEIEEIDGGEHRIVRLMGELDMAGVPMLEGAVSRVCTDRTRSVTLDLSGLDFIDSTGIAAIVHANGMCGNRGYALRLVRGPRRVQRLFELTGLDGVLPFVEPDAAGAETS